MTLNAIVTDINAILSKHGVSDAMQLRDISVTDKTVSDMAKPSPRLSDAITAHLWPSISSATVYHYTSREAAENILSTGIFRLTNIEKRLTDGEIVTFCQTHGLRGYLEPDASGEPTYRALLLPQLFYASLHRSKPVARRLGILLAKLRCVRWCSVDHRHHGQEPQFPENR